MQLSTKKHLKNKVMTVEQIKLEITIAKQDYNRLIELLDSNDFSYWLAASSNTVAPVDNIVESGFNSELKGWIALFKDENNYLDFLKWQREQTKEVSNKPS